jgi:cytochrome P450
MGDAFGPEELAFYTDHFTPRDQREPELRGDAVKVLASKCPVTHSDAEGGYWLVNRYEDVLSAFEDWQTFAATPESVVVPHPAGRRPMYPLENDPPAQREYRHVIQPYLTPRRLAEVETGVRELATELIDSFIEDGHCDLATQFTQPFAGRMLYRFILGLDESEVKMVRGWTDAISFDPGGPEAVILQRKYNVWTDEMLERRRNGDHQDDIIDALLHANIEGKPLSNDEVAGCLEVLIGGGFGTTSDGTLSTMLRLTENPLLRERLRNDLSLIPNAIDEFLRFDPPIAARPRLCTRDTVLNGQEIKAGERVFLFIAAANRDEEEFSEPNDLDLERGRNRHLAFGVGIHRCVGSNVARFNLRIGFEELLTRLGDFEITPGDAPRYAPRQTWGPSYLPLTFTPGERRAPSSTMTKVAQRD